MTSRVRRCGLITAAVMIVVGCGDSDSSSAPATVSPTTPSSSSVSATISPAPIERVVVATYFSRDGILVAGSRAVAKNDSARGAVAAVIDGPNVDEVASRYSSAVPSGTALRNVTIDQRKATVDVSAAFTTGGGSLSMRLRVAQIVYTVTRLGVADSVRFLIDGNAVESIGGEGFIVTNVRQAEFDDLLPPIITEFPTPGATVAPSFVFKGLANVFEGTVNFELLDPNGAVIARGFGTGMMGAWGQFQAPVMFPTRPAGPLVFAVYTVSPKDGSRQNETRLPVRLA